MIDVVGQTDYRDTAIIIENIDVTARDVMLLRSIATVQFAELSVTLSGQGNDVDRLLGIVILKPGELSLIALPIIDFYSIDDLRRQIPQGSCRILPEKLATIYEDPTNGFSLHLYFTSIDDYAG